MRKTTLYSMLLTGFVLFGCSANQQPVNEATNSNTNTNINTTNQVTIDEAKAKEIALKEAGGGQVTEFSQDMDDYTPNYDITILNGTTEYEFEISAVDGSIVSQDKELINQASNSTNIQGVTIDEAKAKEIALGQVPNGTITEISFDYENGVLVYEVTVVEGTTEYDFEISGVDGSIISKSMDSTLD
ncbi:MAG: PepSY domain-containing protein [Turicibacter sp.]|nr:PepSY domain-containing protein [Turicibacter sp.]